MRQEIRQALWIAVFRQGMMKVQLGGKFSFPTLAEETEAAERRLFVVVLHYVGKTVAAFIRNPVR